MLPGASGVPAVPARRGPVRAGVTRLTLSRTASVRERVFVDAPAVGDLAAPAAARPRDMACDIAEVRGSRGSPQHARACGGATSSVRL
ncbi:hypothetical protein GCM10010185_61500 [Saccharothrix coeruleofusca]|uniref:Uncharacterized protein n=1 Tax=Saccharothrix coeruleofusca TaxID=33919 RepID=A0A918ARZ5_9PSEU|nr:hypothetical protein GCM10010185_61500 [Saccharothrix coeruleofusca]